MGLVPYVAGPPVIPISGGPIDLGHRRGHHPFLVHDRTKGGQAPLSCHSRRSSSAPAPPLCPRGPPPPPQVIPATAVVRDGVLARAQTRVAEPSPSSAAAAASRRRLGGVPSSSHPPHLTCGSTHAALPPTAGRSCLLPALAA